MEDIFESSIKWRLYNFYKIFDLWKIDLYSAVIFYVFFFFFRFSLINYFFSLIPHPQFDQFFLFFFFLSFSFLFVFFTFLLLSLIFDFFFFFSFHFLFFIYQLAFPFLHHLRWLSSFQLIQDHSITLKCNVNKEKSGLKLFYNVYLLFACLLHQRNNYFYLLQICYNSNGIYIYICIYIYIYIYI